MVSLVDIGEAKGVVIVRGQNYDVFGLTAEHIVSIMLAFPEIRKVMAEKEADIAMLISQFPIAAALMIAAGTGNGDKKEEIDAASKMPAGLQLEFITEIFNLTFPKGVQSFIEGLRAAVGSLGARGWGADTKSPAPSSLASAPVEASETVGGARQDN